MTREIQKTNQLRSWENNTKMGKVGEISLENLSKL